MWCSVVDMEHTAGTLNQIVQTDAELEDREAWINALMLAPDTHEDELFEYELEQWEQNR